MAPLEFGTPVLVRAEIVRIIATHEPTGNNFKQKALDVKRYGAYKIKDRTTWPGVAIPVELADTPPDWEIEPMPNGNAVMRCRRIELQMPMMGLYLGVARIAEGTLVQRGPNNKRPSWSARELDDRRWLELYEIGAPPTRNGRGRMTLVHPFDAQVVPL